MATKRMIVAGVMACLVWVFAAIPATQAWAQDAAAVNLMLRNDSGSSVDVELVDQYGGNFTATVDGGTSQNQSLQSGSEIKIGGSPIHVVAPSDEGTEIVIAGP